MAENVVFCSVYVSSCSIGYTKLIVSDYSNCLTKIYWKRKINQSQSKIVVAWAAIQLIWRVIHISCLRLILQQTDLLMYSSSFSSSHCILLFCFDFFDRRLCCTFSLLRINSIVSMEKFQQFRTNLNTNVFLRMTHTLCAFYTVQANGNCCRYKFRLK